jgi:hypothetical protein
MAAAFQEAGLRTAPTPSAGGSREGRCKWIKVLLIIPDTTISARHSTLLGKAKGMVVRYYYKYQKQVHL